MGSRIATTSSPDPRYRSIGDYAFLSDCHSTALVSSEGSVDWACFRRFDSGSAFARVLDADRGGFFSIRPTAPMVHSTRRYLPSTLVLETTTATAAGTIRCTDAFAMRQGGSSAPWVQLLRRVEVIDGEVEIEVVVTPRFDYGLTLPWIRDHGGGRYSAVGGDDALVVASQVDLHIDHEGCALHGRVVLGAGEAVAVTAVSQPAHLLDPGRADAGAVRERLEETMDWWRGWSATTDVAGPMADLLARSAMVLKGLCCAPTGAVVAAPTTSLPEIPGGSSNWDYRYCWVRDAALTIEALSEVGHHEVAKGFRDFLLRSAAGHGDSLQIMYGPYGERRLPELELDLEGWRGSAPVRVGNAAATQLQLDVYGHLLDAVHLWHERTGDIDEDEWRFLSSIVDQAIARRDEPDAGIWELRGPPRHYVHSKVMVWVAIDRGIRLVEDHGLPGVDVDRWREARQAVRHDVETRGIDPDGGYFVQYYGAREVDASLLKLAAVGFLPADDERMRRTTDVIMERLGVAPHGLLRRFDGDHESSGRKEGVFLLCSFWLVEVLALQGRVGEAERLLETLVGLGNDLGLFSEEYDVEGGELLGNFPQAFSHLGLIVAEKRLRAARTGGAAPERP